MKTLLALLLITLSFAPVLAQQYKAENGYVRFFSEAALEDIAAENKKGSSIFDVSNGNIVFSIPITSFEFEKSLMREHFNEKYMESEKYPKAVFKGNIADFEDREGTQNLQAHGNMTIHGVTRQINTKGKIMKEGDQLRLTSTFIVRLEDYEVKIPKLLWQNIAEEVEVTLDFQYKPLAQ